MKRHVISIGYGRHMFTERDGERARLFQCSGALPSFHAIIFSCRSHKLSKQVVSETFSLYPTHSFSSFTMILDAVRVGLRIARTSKKGTRWSVTAQDPLGAGVAAYILARLLRCPLVIQEHGDIFSGSYWKNERLANRVWYWIARMVIKRADRVRVVSRRVAEHVHVLGVPKEKIISLPVYTDVGVWNAVAPKVDLHILYPQASTIVLSVARFVPQKNLEMLIQGFSVLHKADPRALLVLVGQGSEESTIAAAISTGGLGDAVVRMPWTDDVPSLMKTADIYALTSNYEGWARVLVEAMLCGLPVVTTEVGCVGEYFIPEKHGLAVPVGDVGAFGRALVSLTSDKEKRDLYSKDAKVDAQHIFREGAGYAEEWAYAHADF